VLIDEVPRSIRALRIETRNRALSGTLCNCQYCSQCHEPCSSTSNTYFASTDRCSETQREPIYNFCRTCWSFTFPDLFLHYAVESWDPLDSQLRNYPPCAFVVMLTVGSVYCPVKTARHSHILNAESCFCSWPVAYVNFFEV